MPNWGRWQRRHELQAPQGLLQPLAMSNARNRRTRTRNYVPLGGPSAQTMREPDYQSDDDATAADNCSNPDMEPVPMPPLPTAEPPNQVGAAQGAGPAAEGLADGPIAHRLRPSSCNVSPRGTIRSRLFAADNKDISNFDRNISKNKVCPKRNMWFKIKSQTKRIL